jgi:hypothetical protein
VTDLRREARALKEVVAHQSERALPAVGDGLSEPQQRRVEIRF